MQALDELILPIVIWMHKMTRKSPHYTVFFTINNSSNNFRFGVHIAASGNQDPSGRKNGATADIVEVDFNKYLDADLVGKLISCCILTICYAFQRNS